MSILNYLWSIPSFMTGPSFLVAEHTHMRQFGVSLPDFSFGWLFFALAAILMTVVVVPMEVIVVLLVAGVAVVICLK